MLLIKMAEFIPDTFRVDPVAADKDAIDVCTKAFALEVMATLKAKKPRNMTSAIVPLETVKEILSKLITNDPGCEKYIDLCASSGHFYGYELRFKFRL